MDDADDEGFADLRIMPEGRKSFSREWTGFRIKKKIGAQIETSSQTAYKILQRRGET